MQNDYCYQLITHSLVNFNEGFYESVIWKCVFKFKQGFCCCCLFFMRGLASVTLKPSAIFTSAHSDSNVYHLRVETLPVLS